MSFFTKFMSDCQSQSQRYFTTGGLLPISSSWRQAPWDSRPEFFFWTPAVIVHCWQIMNKFPSMKCTARRETYYRQAAHSFNHSFIHSPIHHRFYGPLLGPCLFFSFIIFFTQMAGLLGRVISPSQGRYLHHGQHKHRINAYIDIHALSGTRTHDPSLEFMHQGIADWHARVWRRVQITSTVVLRVVKGDGKEPSAGGYNWATLFLGDINTGTWAPGWGSLKSETVKCGHESCGTQTWEWKRWQGPAAIANDKPILSSKGCYIRTTNARAQLKKNSGRESQGAWRQDKLIGGKPSLVK
jgi:hypothetical protein